MYGRVMIEVGVGGTTNSNTEPLLDYDFSLVLTTDPPDCEEPGTLMPLELPALIVKSYKKGSRA